LVAVWHVFPGAGALTALSAFVAASWENFMPTGGGGCGKYTAAQSTPAACRSKPRSDPSAGVFHRVTAAKRYFTH
jgi:hypothetical protein